MATYQNRGTEPQALSGEVLRNTIGQTLGITPDNITKRMSDAELTKFSEGGLSSPVYGDNKSIKAIADELIKHGGDEPQVSIIPVVVTSNEFGASVISVFRVEGLDGKPHFIESINPGRSYEGFSGGSKSWLEGSQLPPGRMTYPSGMDLSGSNGALSTANTAAVTDTFGECFFKVGDAVALGVGIGAGVAVAVALVAGTGGAALPVVAGAASGLYVAGRAGEQLHDAHQHGENVLDLSNAQIRAKWIDVAAGTLSFGALGATRSAAKLVSAGSGSARVASTSAAALQLSANTVDVIATSNEANNLRANWGELSNAEKATGLLSLAVWGGMTSVGAKAGGGQIRDEFSFTRLRNNIEYGTPYAVVESPALQPGQMRVAYERSEGGRATDIRIERGPGGGSPEMLALHVSAARNIEASGGLSDRLSAFAQGEARFEVGSAAWEAKHEITKLSTEQDLLVEQLSQANLGSSDNLKIDSRLSELETELVHQSERLDLFDSRGLGWVASSELATSITLGFDKNCDTVR